MDRNSVEEKRKYLGGDSEHTVLVKGLDFALLEQTKARTAAQVDGDDSLEDAFHNASTPVTTQSSIPKKRTREDIIRELKEKRTKNETNTKDVTPGEETTKIATLKQEGKVKPIGFKPIGSSSKSKDNDGAKKKKKRRVEGTGDSDKTTAKKLGGSHPSNLTNDSTGTAKLATEAGPSKPSKSRTPEPEPIDEDFDIFADAGEYKGIDYDEDGEDAVHRPRDVEEETVVPVKPGRWFDEGPEPEAPPRPPSPATKEKGKSKANEPDKDSTDEVEPGEEPEPEKPMRLAPLASSAVPSIRDMLAMDQALEAEEKRRARKEKKKKTGGGEEMSASAKLDRDYQKLKSYQERKGG